MATADSAGATRPQGGGGEGGASSGAALRSNFLSGFGRMDLLRQMGLLIALAAKNAILIVEFAMMKHREGFSPMEAAMESARLRFRPIMMTAVSFILGSIPLALASGAGANSQQAIGIGVIGGMLSATFLAVLFVPMFYYLITMLTDRVSAIRAERRAEAQTDG